MKLAVSPSFGGRATRSLCEATLYKYENTRMKLAVSYSPSCEVPSPLGGLTAVFGMGTGITLPLNHQLHARVLPLAE